MNICPHFAGVLRCTLAACSALAATAGAAHAELPPQTLAAALALAGRAAAALAPAQARIEVEPGHLDPRLKLAPCTRIEPYLPGAAPAWGRTRVGLRCTQGSVAWNVYLPITVKVWAPAVVSTLALPAGARLSTTQLGRQEADWAVGAAPFVSDEALAGRTLVRAVAAGQALRRSDLKPLQWFAIGDVVRVDAVGAGFTISAQGQALTPGLEDQEARVRTENGRVLSGRPAGARRVEVAL